MTPLSWAAFCASLIGIGYLIIDAVRKNNDDEKNEEDINEQKEDTE